MGEVGEQYLKPKDSNAVVGVWDCATQKSPEGHEGQTGKQTNKLFMHYSKNIICIRDFTQIVWLRPLL